MGDETDVHPCGPDGDSGCGTSPWPQEPIIGPGPAAADEIDVTLPRLARHEITLADGHTVGRRRLRPGRAARRGPRVLGRGDPLRPDAVTPGRPRVQGDRRRHRRPRRHPRPAHRGARAWPATPRCSAGCSTTSASGPAVLAGHSMGGRLVTELAASEPDRAIAVILLDAIVGDTWDRMVNVFRVFPPLLVGTGATLVVDTVTTVPLFRDPRRPSSSAASSRPRSAATSGGRGGCSARPRRSCAAGARRPMLDKLREERIPVFAIHGDRDIAVPIATAKDAARRARGDLVVVKGGSHSWLLKDPETMPGDHARPHAGPARHGRAEGQARAGRRPRRRHRRRGRGGALRPRRPGAGAHAPPATSTTPRTCTARPATRWTVHPRPLEGPTRRSGSRGLLLP